MDIHQDSNSWHQCRLCGIFGHHKIDIFDEQSRPGPSNASALSSNIFRCVEVLVERGDKTTKMCGNCFSEIRHYIGFRAVCAETNRKMKNSQRLSAVMSGDISDETIPGQYIPNTPSFSGQTVLLNRYSLSGPSVEVISLIDDETESENDEMDAAGATQNADVEGTSFDGERPPIEKRRRAEMRKRQKREADRSASTKRGSPATTNSTPTSHGKECAQHQRNDAESVTREPRHCSPLSKTTVACDTLTDDRATSDIAAASSQDDQKCGRNGKFSYKTKKQAKNKAVKKEPHNLVECRSRGRCKESFGSWGAMMYHVATYHAKGVKKTFSCHLCKKTFSNRGHLQQHMDSVHNREIRFMCPIRRCAKIFTQKGHLKQHTNAVHTKRVAFKCTKCPMKFYCKQYLTRHLANKHGVGMTFSCYLCKKESYGKQGLQRHMNSLHTGQVRFTCPFPMCSKSFTQKNHLSTHTNAIHTKKNVFKCTECDKEYYYKQLLNRHVANKH